ncbi:hypothetical protein SAMN02745673_00556 [Marinactinospora thermotolerans DSM 45154]|uniref:Uncharacterized protein n=1 Tax=Marinactinospora thermotolerans DSM 45154 TaxID=1122192 RepID=A0A1T4KV54_9ACTN|nr:hypothetical protein [Marinactinospora thermotolerans]SJZ46322.1 hypothetical protein SAMN02745673_00556 [Marinactinospora thermotolerans DSM 45154]
MIIVCLVLVVAALVVIGAALVLAEQTLVYIALGLGVLTALLLAVEFVRARKTLFGSRQDHRAGGTLPAEVSRTGGLGKASVRAASVGSTTVPLSLGGDSGASTSTAPASAMELARAVSFPGPDGNGEHQPPTSGVLAHRYLPPTDDAWSGDSRLHKAILTTGRKGRQRGDGEHAVLVGGDDHAVSHDPGDPRTSAAEESVEPGKGSGEGERPSTTRPLRHFTYVVPGESAPAQVREDEDDRRDGERSADAPREENDDVAASPGDEEAGLAEHPDRDTARQDDTEEGPDGHGDEGDVTVLASDRSDAASAEPEPASSGEEPEPADDTAEPVVAPEPAATDESDTESLAPLRHPVGEAASEHAETVEPELIADEAWADDPSDDTPEAPRAAEEPEDSSLRERDGEAGSEQGEEGGESSPSGQLEREDEDLASDDADSSAHDGDREVLPAPEEDAGRETAVSARSERDGADSRADVDSAERDGDDAPGEPDEDPDRTVPLRPTTASAE